MKKIFHLIWITTLITTHAMATEVAFGTDLKSVETIRTLRAQLRSLKEYSEAQELTYANALSQITVDKEKETATKKAVMRENFALRREQQEAKELLDDVLHSVTSQDSSNPLPIIASSALPIFPSKDQKMDPQERPTPTLSTYQQEFLHDWNNGQGRIGPKAWEALGSGNESLARAMRGAIHSWQNQKVELASLENKYFTLLVGKFIQDKMFRY